jgi:hypothetical protein
VADAWRAMGAGEIRASLSEGSELAAAIVVVG